MSLPLHTHPYAETDAFWTGALSAVIAMNVKRVTEHPKGAQAELRRALEDFLRSPVPSAEQRKTLRGYLK